MSMSFSFYQFRSICCDLHIMICLSHAGMVDFTESCRLVPLVFVVLRFVRTFDLDPYIFGL